MRINQIEKRPVAAGALLTVTLLSAIFVVPAARREIQKRNEVADGVELVTGAFSRIEPEHGTAILAALPSTMRGYRILLDGTDRDLPGSRPSTKKFSVPLAIKTGSRLVFKFEDHAYNYKVTSIDDKGVRIEVGNDTRAHFFSNRSITLPWITSAYSSEP